MTIHQVSELALKILAILCFTYAISHLGYYSSYFFIEQVPPLDYIISSGVGPIIGPIVVGIVLFLKARSWGGRIVSAEESRDVPPGISVSEWHSMFLSLMGLFFVVSTLVPLINHLFAIFRANSQPGSEGLSVTAIAWLIGYGATILVGLWFALGSRGIVGTIRKLRNAGL